ncbi:MAG: YdbC family protein [Clostridia bacterium]|nr:YdbC family protein [Clostridia bacterium]
MPEFTYEVVENVAVLSENPKGWTKELNLISWNGREPKYDIREWAPDHEKMGKGVTLSKEEMEALCEAVKKLRVKTVSDAAACRGVIYCNE